MKKIKNYFLSIGFLCWVATCNALTLNLPKQGDVVGEIKTQRLHLGETIFDFARENDVGYYELLEANPKLNPNHLGDGVPLVIPTRYVLPHVSREGIVINLAELRLYYFPPGGNIVMTYPIGIGRQGWDTPSGDFKIVEKTKDPVWHVPASIAKDAFQYDGTVLPKEVEPGPDNPLGQYAMRLNIPNYLLHGTNVPTSIGRRVSGGCIRMYPEDIESLFNAVPVDTPVKIINEPYKIGLEDHQLIMEAHQPLSEMRKEHKNQLQIVWEEAINHFIETQSTPMVVDWAKVNQVATRETGLPQVIGSHAT